VRKRDEHDKWGPKSGGAKLSFPCVHGWKHGWNGRINHKFSSVEGNLKNFVAHKELIKISVALKEFTL
jgi:hypothetical protein